MCWHILECRSCPNDWYHRCREWCHMWAHIGMSTCADTCQHGGDTINWQPVRTHLARRPLQQTDPRPYYHQARSGGNRRQDWRVYDSRPYYNNRSRTYRDTRVGGHDSHRKDRNEDNYRNDRREDSPINPYPHEQPASAVQYDYHYDTQHVVSRNDEQFHIPQRVIYDYRHGDRFNAWTLDESRYLHALIAKSFFSLVLNKSHCMCLCQY